MKEVTIPCEKLEKFIKHFRMEAEESRRYGRKHPSEEARFFGHGEALDDAADKLSWLYGKYRWEQDMESLFKAHWREYL